MAVLKCFRSLWGTPSARQLGVDAPHAYAAALFRHVRAQGYDGVEASVADLEALGGLATARALLAEHDLRLIVGVYSGWGDYEPAGLAEQFDSVDAHAARLRSQLENVCTAFPDAADRPVRINAHSGADRWSRREQLTFVARALALEQELGCAPVCHETHRGRVFFSPWSTLELLEAFPRLQLTLDFSHWCVVSERLLDTPQDRAWLERVLPHVRHVHGRVGSDQAAQLALPDAPVHAAETERFERLWSDVWRHQHAASTASGDSDDEWRSTFTPEYGPVPYAPRHHADVDAAAYDVDLLCAQRAARERVRFQAALT
ncbi:hypothetical protein PybrP1_006145 [[Pythium] brassicae (nom. inval.)]|nr:hypothetical protein PybrP1_006145 [[Pythium] brassicae (nom. inval.)]